MGAWPVRPHRVFAVLGSAIAVCGCVGTLGGTDGPPTGNVVPIDCQGPAVAAAAPLTRLQKTEYVATLRELVGADVAFTDNFPLDITTGTTSFVREDRDLAQQHVDTFYRTADAVAKLVSGDATRRRTLLGDCGANVDDACLSTFIPGFLAKAYRRAPSPDELSAAMGLLSTYHGNDAVHAVVFTTLMSPDFLYRFENHGAVSGGTIQLTGYEIATRLAFTYWGAPPDQQLLDAARSGQLEDEAGYAAQVERVISDPRAQATIMSFFEEWLSVDGAQFASSPRANALRGDLDTNGLADEMHEEVRDLLRYALDHDMSWTDVITTDLSFARTARLAGIYGVPVWDGTSPPPHLPAGQRSGIFTRAGMVYGADGSTNPFTHGAFFRQDVLCDTVLPPPSTIPAELLTPPVPMAGQSTRQAFEGRIANEPCKGCHAGFAPLGYTLEIYDGFGRFRTQEHVVDVVGTDFGMVPVDARAIAQVDSDDDQVVNGVVELSQRFAESPKSNQCFARHLFRYAYRQEETAGDACTIGSMVDRFTSGGSMRAVLTSIAMEPSFRQRKLED
jgi:Protein of unknown function (DUF1592)/Protein of unknown function (DUF1588)/Protein of unknown function (DUF1585)/Protein of unknown function (DUF1595)/Protein of unknown function (DUF1587)